MAYCIVTLASVAEVRDRMAVGYCAMWLVLNIVTLASVAEVRDRMTGGYCALWLIV